MIHSPTSLYIVMIGLLAIGMIFCAVQAIRATHLLTNALWLAGVSALLAILLYVMGAHHVAVIELSVGAGLVTVLFVFAINIAGEETGQIQSMLPGPLSWGLVLLSSILLAWLTFPVTGLTQQISEIPFAGVLWEQRGLDMLVQVVLIFSGVLGILGLLAGARTSTKVSTLQPVAMQKVEAPPEPSLAKPALEEVPG